MMMLPVMLMMLPPLLMLMPPRSAGARASHAAPRQPLTLPPRPPSPSAPAEPPASPLAAPHPARDAGAVADGAPLVAAATVPAPAPRTSLLLREMRSLLYRPWRLL